jgi:hypothetical protein
MKERLRSKVVKYSEFATAVKLRDLQTPGISQLRDANGGIHTGPDDLPLEMAKQMIAVGDDFAAMPLIDGIDEDELLDLRFFMDIALAQGRPLWYSPPRGIKGAHPSAKRQKKPGGRRSDQ